MLSPITRTPIPFRKVYTTESKAIRDWRKTFPWQSRTRRSSTTSSDTIATSSDTITMYKQDGVNIVCIIREDNPMFNCRIILTEINDADNNRARYTNNLAYVYTRLFSYKS